MLTQVIKVIIHLVWLMHHGVRYLSYGLDYLCIFTIRKGYMLFLSKKPHDEPY